MIRTARPEDSHAVIPLMLEAIGNIAHDLSGTDDEEYTKKVLAEYFKAAGNRLSYTHCIVWEERHEVAGFALFYDGSQVHMLDAPLEERLSKVHGHPVQLIKESQRGEFYLDSLAVDAKYRGRGIAKHLMAAFEQEAVKRGLQRAALLVDVANDKARRLYEAQGYHADGLVLTIANDDYDHMVKPVS